jgi:predicted nucleotidyltransferase
VLTAWSCPSRLTEFCRQNRIRYLAFFGSVLRDDFGPDSDVDVLVQFEEGHTPSLFGIVRLEDELSAILRRKADLRTPEDLSRYFRDKTLAEAAVQYVA